jgi:predicted acyl esterase
MTASVVCAAPQEGENEREQMVAMRDGVKLATNVYLPKKGEGPWPVILNRTPYNKEGGLVLSHTRYTHADYVYVVQDCRGRFRSEGDYRPFQDDQLDGYDTIQWIASQPWCNGKVGMSGASAMGITSMAAAVSQPEALKAAFVIVTPESFWNEAIFIGGAFKKADVEGWLKGQNALDQLEDRRSSLTRTEEELTLDLIQNRQKIEIPIYHIGGWYDIFSNGTQGNFHFLFNQGSPGARGAQKLMMGPFGHGGLKGDLRYRKAGGILGAMTEEIRWFDYHLKGIDNGIMDEPPVKYYQMASARKDAMSDKNGWEEAPNWPPASTQTRYYLTASNGLAAKKPSGAPDPSKYRFDPANPVPTVGGANLQLPLGPMDQREIGQRDDYLRFTSAPLEEDVKIAGSVNFELWAATDAPDTDFMVKLVDVYPDGYEALLLDAPIRCRYREGRRPQDIKRMPEGKPVKLEIPLGGTANIFEKGHRIAIHVTSSNAPRFDVNPNTGHDAGKSDHAPREANNSIYHDAKHPSAVVLPVIP